MASGRGITRAVFKWASIPALLLICTPAAAEMYRWLDDRGRVHFGDRPGINARSIEDRKDLAAAAGPASPGLSVETIEEVRERARDRVAARDEAHAAVVRAGEALSQAKERRKRAEEPLPGERRGLAGGGSRLGPEYVVRQARMEEEVRRAQAGLDAALAARNGLH